MDIHDRLRQLMDARGWSEYRLAKESGLSPSTLANIFKRNTLPSIPTLEAVCGAFRITLAQFFAEGDMIEVTPEQKELFEDWRVLSPELKEATRQMLKAINNSGKSKG